MKNKVFSNLRKSIFYLQQSILEDEHKKLYDALDIMVNQLEENRQNAIKKSLIEANKQLIKDNYK